MYAFVSHSFQLHPRVCTTFLNPILNNISTVNIRVLCNLCNSLSTPIHTTTVTNTMNVCACVCVCACACACACVHAEKGDTLASKEHTAKTQNMLEHILNSIIPAHTPDTSIISNSLITSPSTPYMMSVGCWEAKEGLRVRLTQIAAAQTRGCCLFYNSQATLLFGEVCICVYVCVWWGVA